MSTENIFYAMVNAIQELDSKISNIIATVKANFEILKQVQDDVFGVKADVSSVKNEVAQLKKENKQLKEQNKNLETRLLRLEAKLK